MMRTSAIQLVWAMANCITPVIAHQRDDHARHDADVDRPDHDAAVPSREDPQLVQHAE